MTLVCAAHHDRVPLVFGDVLLSATIKEHAVIATYDRTAKLAFDDPSKKIAGVHSKLVTVKPKLAIGWTAANIVEAEQLVRYLQGNLGAEPKLDELQATLSSRYQIRPNVPVVIVGVLMFGTRFAIFRWDGRTGEFSTGPFFAAGTGAAHLKTGTDLPGGNWLSPKNDPVGAAAGWALNNIGHLLGDEILDGANLPNYFGGGFDAIVWCGERFKHVGSLVQFFLYVKLGKSGRQRRIAWGPYLTSFWQTFNGTLHIERVDFREPSRIGRMNMKMPIAARKKLTVPTFEGLSGQEEVDNSLRFALVHKRVLVENFGVAQVCTVYDIPNTDIHVAKAPGELRFRFSEAFITNLGASILENAPKLASQDTFPTAVRDFLRDF